MSEPALSYTEIRTFLECGQKWHWSSTRRLNLEPKQPNKHLFLGRCIHAALADLYSRDKQRAPLAVYDAAVRAEYKIIEADVLLVPPHIVEYAALGRAMFQHYIIWAAGKDNFSPICTEVQLEAPLDGFDINVKGTLDMLAVTGRGDSKQVWIVEHKTYTTSPSQTELDMALQPMIYYWLASKDERLAMYVQAGQMPGMLFNILIKTAPKAPRVLKSGKLSQAKNQNTTRYLYEEAITTLGLERADYEELIAALDPDKFNRRLYRYMDEIDLLRINDLLVRTAEEMLSDPVILPVDSINRCGRCRYLPLCSEMFSGGDWKSCMELDFKKREKRKEV